MPFAFRAHHQALGQESIRLHAAVAYFSIVQPELFNAVQMAGDVEIRGDLTKGETVFDRRVKTLWMPNMDVVTEIDSVAVTDCIKRALTDCGRRT
jgi:inosine-uridine nucleoside N-ribohydrolase